MAYIWLFALLAILIGYLEGPEFISLAVKRMSLELEPASHIVATKKQVTVKYDKDFLKDYKCDENHGYRIEILERAPLVMQKSWLREKLNICELPVNH